MKVLVLTMNHALSTVIEGNITVNIVFLGNEVSLDVVNECLI